MAKKTITLNEANEGWLQGRREKAEGGEEKKEARVMRASLIALGEQVPALQEDIRPVIAHIDRVAAQSWFKMDRRMLDALAKAMLRQTAGFTQYMPGFHLEYEVMPGRFMTIDAEYERDWMVIRGELEGEGRPLRAEANVAPRDVDPMASHSAMVQQFLPDVMRAVNKVVTEIRRKASVG